MFDSATLGTVTCQAPLSMGAPSPGDLSYPEIELPTLQADSLQEFLQSYS